MTTRLTLVCHAPTEAMHAARFPADEPLTNAGLAAAAAATRFTRLDHALTAPHHRCVQTAEAPS